MLAKDENVGNVAWMGTNDKIFVGGMQVPPVTPMPK